MDRRGHGLELEVRGEPKNRYPDLTIIREEHIQLLSQRNTILLSMLPPLLVIEVVRLKWLVQGKFKESEITSLKEFNIKIVGFPNTG